MTELNDELLVAYVDGQLAKDQSKAVERVLQEDRVAAQRVEALRAANAHLETAFEAMLAGEPIVVPGAMDEVSRESGPRLGTVTSRIRGVALFAWVGLGCLLGGAAGGYILYDQIGAETVEIVAVIPPSPATSPAPVLAPVQRPVTPTWEDDVARTHALLSRDTFAVGLDGAGNRDLVAFQISKVLGADFTIPDLNGENLTFQRAQILQRENVPFAQISYLPESGAPLALYARARSGEPRSITVEERGDLSLATWTSGDLSLLLAGWMPGDALRGLADLMDGQLSSAEPAARDTGMPVPSPAAETGSAETNEAAPEAASD